MRVLFVDDHPGSLQQLREALDGVVDWEMDFVESTERALALLDKARYAALVTSSSNPVDLLRRVQAKHPGVARLVRTLDTSVTANLRALFAAHQVLAPDIDLGQLVYTVSNASDLQMMLSSEELRALIGRVRHLPARPIVYSKLVELLAKPDADFRAVGQLVQSDVSIATEIIRVVNTPFFSRGRNVTNIIDAVGRLGTRTVRDLVLAIEIFSSVADKKTVQVIEQIQRHSIETAIAARSLVSRPEDRDDAFLAGLLHDVGRLVIVATMPSALEIAAADDSLDLERELIGVTHPAIGAYLIGLWGLPYSVMWAAASHHEVSVLGEGLLDVAGAVLVAEQVLNETNLESQPAGFALWRSTAQEALGMKNAS